MQSYEQYMIDNQINPDEYSPEQWQKDLAAQEQLWAAVNAQFAPAGSAADTQWRAAYKQWVDSGAKGAAPERPAAPPQITPEQLAAHQAAATAAGTSSGTGVMDRVQPAGAIYGGQNVGGTVIAPPKTEEPGTTTPTTGGFDGLVTPTTQTVTPQNPGAPAVNPPTVTGGGGNRVTPPTTTGGGGGGVLNPPGTGVVGTNPVLPPTAKANLSFGDLATPTLPTVTLPGLNVQQPNVPGLSSLPQGGVGGTSGTGGAGTASPSQNAQVNAYLAAHPDILNNWRNAQADPNSEGGKAILGYGSLEDYVRQDALANGTPQDKQWAEAYTTPTTNVTAGTPDIPAVAGENFRQTQLGNQSGSFNTTGTTNTAQGTTSGQTSAGSKATAGVTNTSQAQTSGSQTGTSQTGVTQGTVGTDQTTTTGVTDTLGFGALLKGQTGAAQAADATRQGFLTDLVTTGGGNLQSQVDQAVRNSMTGPQMTGAGESARARAAGYAAAEMGRKNTQERLAAAGQLAGPTAVQGLVGAGTPFLGQTQSTKGTQTTDMKNVVDSLSNTTGFQNLVGQTAQQGLETTQGATQGYQNSVGQSNESQSGTAKGSSAQAAAGVIPEGKTTTAGGGGCIICTAGMEHGLWKRPRLLRRVTRHKVVDQWPRFRHAARGYFFLFGPLARLALRSRTVSRLTMPIANAVVYEEARIAGVDLPFRPIPWAIHWTWHGLCSAVGHLPLRNDVADEDLLVAAQKHGTFFKVGV